MLYTSKTTFGNTGGEIPERLGVTEKGQTLVSLLVLIKDQAVSIRLNVRFLSVKCAHCRVLFEKRRKMEQREFRLRSGNCTGFSFFLDMLSFDP